MSWRVGGEDEYYEAPFYLECMECGCAINEDGECLTCMEEDAA